MKPIFVLGCPRSGTTVIGALVGSVGKVLQLGEFGGFYLGGLLAPQYLMGRMQSPVRDEYLSALFEHAGEFAMKQARRMQCAWYVDSTPGNLLIADRLAAAFPSAQFILTLRHYSGTVLSLARSYRAGFRWAGSTWPKRAQLWSTFYACAALLPRDRTTVVSYERLCANPACVVESLLREIHGRTGLEITSADLTLLARSHATTTHRRPTIGSIVDGEVRLHSIPSRDRRVWTAKLHSQIKGEVRTVDQLLRRLYPRVYTSPIGNAR